MKICVFGGGAIGCFLAGHLAQVPGCTVSVVARGAQLEAIRRDGLVVHTPRGELRARVQATDRPAELGAQDYVFVTLKSNQVPAALPGFAPLLGEDTVVLPPTTGIPYWFFDAEHGGTLRLGRVDPDERERAAIAPRRVLGCVYWIPVEVIAGGVVRQHGPFGAFPVGEPDGSITPRVSLLSEAMQAGGLQAPVSRDIRAEIWMKAVSSLCWNPVAVLTRASLGQIGESAGIVRMVRQMMLEADAMAARLGVTPTMAVEARMGMALGAGAHRMSMLQDLERGRPLEFDVVRASFEDIRELAGVPTPTLDLVVTLMSLRARTVAEERARA
jgi:2-dehydropantoate 2-reductase